MKTRSTVTLLMFTTILGSSLTSACGAMTDSNAVTETGNPSLIDKTRITTTPLDGAIKIEGEKNAVPANASVTATNQSTDEKETVTADGNGSFSLQLEGKAGDEVVLKVKTDDASDTLELTFDTATQPPDTTDSSVAPTTTVPSAHRSAAETCDTERGPGFVEDSEYQITGDCDTDAQCLDGVRGRCTVNRELALCTYDACESDNDCSAGPCICGAGAVAANECMAGNCKLDGDCGAGGYCSPSQSTCGNYSGVVGYWCHTAEDECVNDTECTSAEQGDGYCMYSPEASHWLCSFSQCAG
jgi:hypothetical protein